VVAKTQGNTKNTRTEK